MAESRRLLSAIIGSATIVGAAILGVAVLSETYTGGMNVVGTSLAASKSNFTALGGQCKVSGLNGNVKGLAIEQGTGQNCICPSRKAYESLLRNYPEASLLNCSLKTDQITNFNQPSSSTTNGSTTNGSTSGTLPGNPGNHKPVGNATEGPPGGNEAHFGCCGPGTTTDSTGATGPTGGDKGASN